MTDSQEFLIQTVEITCSEKAQELKKNYPTPQQGVTRWHSWWRHCAISRKVAASIRNGVIAIFH